MLIKISDHHKDKIVGSLKFNYMIPVPDYLFRLPLTASQSACSSPPAFP